MAGAARSEIQERLSAADETVLDEMRRLFGPAVAALVRRKFAGRLRAVEAEGVLQEALLRAWEACGRFDCERANLRTWFLGIARNVARDISRCGWAKQRAREVSLNAEYPVEERETTRARGGLRASGTANKSAKLVGAIQALGNREQYVIMDVSALRDRLNPTVS